MKCQRDKRASIAWWLSRFGVMAEEMADDSLALARLLTERPLVWRCVLKSTSMNALVRRLAITAVIGCFGAIAACSDDDGAGEADQVAPTELRARTARAAVYLTWQDNAEEEAHFVVYRRPKEQVGDGSPIAFPDENATSYTDFDGVSGQTYVYKVQSMSIDNVPSRFSNAVEAVYP